MIKKKCDFLVCTIRLDPHSDAVIEYLESKGKNVFRLNTEDFYTKYDFTLIQNSTQNFIRIINKVNGKYLESCEYKIPAFYRKPSDVIPNIECIDEVSKDVSSKEAEAFLKMLYASNLFYWINDKFHNIRASRKNFQLEIAKKHGLNFPDTLITTCSKEAIRFFKRNKEKVILKPLNVSNYQNEDELYSIYAELIDKEIFYNNIESIGLAPIFIQEYIEKEYELRICVFGDSVFCCKLNSQINEKTKIDWRVVNPVEIEHEIIEIPTWLKDKLIKINNELNLDFGIFDFIYTPSGEFYFLENNPNGQWYWIEIITKAEMSKAMGQLLEKHSCQHRI